MENVGSWGFVILTVDQNQILRWKIYPTLLANHGLAISWEYYFPDLKPVTFHIGLCFDGVNIAQQRQWMVL